MVAAGGIAGRRRAVGRLLFRHALRASKPQPLVDHVVAHDHRPGLRPAHGRTPAAVQLSAEGLETAVAHGAVSTLPVLLPGVQRPEIDYLIPGGGDFCVSAVAGFARVEFPDSPDFGESYWLQAWSEESVRILFTKDIRDHFEQHKEKNLKGTYYLFHCIYQAIPAIKDAKHLIFQQQASLFRLKPRKDIFHPK